MSLEEQKSKINTQAASSGLRTVGNTVGGGGGKREVSFFGGTPGGGQKEPEGGVVRKGGEGRGGGGGCKEYVVCMDELPREDSKEL